MASTVDIANLALSHLGEERLVALTDNVASARAVDLIYEDVRDEVLRAHRWNFAVKRAVLTALVTAPAFGWALEYPLPNDCLRVLEVNDSEFGDTITDEYVVEGRSILTDAESLNLVYIRRVEEVSQFDPIFKQALALKLAAGLAEKLRGSTGKTADLIQQYERITAPLARRIDANEGRRRKGLLPVSSQAIRARLAGATPWPTTTSE